MVRLPVFVSACLCGVLLMTSCSSPSTISDETSSSATMPDVTEPVVITVAEGETLDEFTLSLARLASALSLQNRISGPAVSLMREIPYWMSQLRNAGLLDASDQLAFPLVPGVYEFSAAEVTANGNLQSNIIIQKIFADALADIDAKSQARQQFVDAVDAIVDPYLGGGTDGMHTSSHAPDLRQPFVVVVDQSEFGGSVDKYYGDFSIAASVDSSQTTVMGISLSHYPKNAADLKYIVLVSLVRGPIVGSYDGGSLAFEGWTAVRVINVTAKTVYGGSILSKTQPPKQILGDKYGVGPLDYSAAKHYIDKLLKS